MYIFHLSQYVFFPNTDTIKITYLSVLGYFNNLLKIINYFYITSKRIKYTVYLQFTDLFSTLKSWNPELELITYINY